jgi:hypothetical protein
MEENYPNAIVVRQLAAALVGLIEGKVCLTEGVREFVRWRSSNHGLPEELFDPLVGIDSETDNFPVGASRLEWEPTALARADKDREAVEEHYREYALREATVLYKAALARLPKASFNKASQSLDG